MLTIAVCAAPFVLVGLWAMWNERPTAPALTIHGVPREDAHSLFEALVEYIETGGDAERVIGYGTNAHPSGHNHVYLVTQADVVAGAERLLREVA